MAIWTEAVLLPDAARAALAGDARPMETILTGVGSCDCERPVTVAPGHAGRVEGLAKEPDRPLTWIGRVARGGGWRPLA